MSHLWKLEDFQAELQHLAKLHEKRPGSPVVSALLQTFCKKIQAAESWSSQAICTLLEDVESLNFSTSMANVLSTTIEQLNLHTGQAVKLAKSGQSVTNLAAYLTSQDWNKMMTQPVTIIDQLTVIACRLQSMGVTSLKEHTKIQGVALVLYCQEQLGKPLLSPIATHQLVDDLKQLHKAADPVLSVPSCTKYPNNPMELGQEWLRQAYGTEVPECRNVALAAHMSQAGLCMCLLSIVCKQKLQSCTCTFLSVHTCNQVACRGTNKKLQPNMPSERMSSTAATSVNPMAAVAGKLEQLLDKWVRPTEPQALLKAPAVPPAPAPTVQSQATVSEGAKTMEEPLPITNGQTPKESHTSKAAVIKDRGNIMLFS